MDLTIRSTGKVREDMKTKLVIALVGLFVITCGLLYSVLVAEHRVEGPKDEKLVVKLIKGNIVRTHDVETGETRDLYHSEKHWTHNITVSPNNKYIALIEETKPEYSIDNYTVPPVINLLIIDGSGNYVNRIDMDVRIYVWSPDGEQIAFLTFRPCDADYMYKCPTGAWVFHVGTSDLTKLADKAQDIRWVIADNTVYLRDHDSVLAWHPDVRLLEVYEGHDINFSPDGAYYLHTPRYEQTFSPKLYRTLNNEDISYVLPTDIGALVGWVWHTGHYLLYTKADEIRETVGEGPIEAVISREVRGVSNSIYDPQRREVVKTFEGAIGAWTGDGSHVIVERDGKVVLEEMP